MARGILVFTDTDEEVTMKALYEDDNGHIGESSDESLAHRGIAALVKSIQAIEEGTNNVTDS